MGRWLKKVENIPKTELTKPTLNPSVSFVGTNSKGLREKFSDKIDLIKFVERCCRGFSVTPEHIIDSFLSIDDERDIINGMVPDETLRLYIQLWIEMGKPHYSGKPID